MEERARLEASLIEFFRAAWPEFDPAPYVHGWHLEAISQHLEAVNSGQIRKLVINVPPRHSKTLLTSVAWPVWTWARSAVAGQPLIGPQVKFLCLSYSGQLALEISTISHRLVLSEWFQRRWGDRVRITADQDAKNKFDTTAGGTRISASIGSGITGRGGDIKIIDDPHNMSEVESQTVREGVIRQYDGALKSRITDPKHSAEVLIAQRGHEADLSAHMLDDPNVVHLNLPAEYDSFRHCVTVLGWEDPRTVDGQLLWEDRFGAAELAPYKINPFEWSAQWQQAPTPRGGGIIKADWWQVWDRAEAMRYGLEWNDEPGRLKELPACELIIASLDSAYSKKQEADYSALTIWGGFTDRSGNRKWMILFAWQRKLEFHDLIEAVSKDCRKYGVTRLLVEGKASGLSVEQELRRAYARENFAVQVMNPTLDKIARAHSVVYLFTDKMVWIPDPNALAWADMVIGECASFPRGSHDDIPDSVTQALGWLRLAGLAERRDEHTAQIDDMMTFRSRKTTPIYPGM